VGADQDPPDWTGGRLNLGDDVGDFDPMIVIRLQPCVDPNRLVETNDAAPGG
jgi:hypothetical protein